jgi:dienelactone hydrolase
VYVVGKLDSADGSFVESAVAADVGQTEISLGRASMPSLGHHRHLIRSLAAKAARPLSFLSGRYPDQELWRGYARKKIFELLHYAPPRVDFRPEILEEVDAGPYLRRKLWFSSSQHTRVSAYLLLPSVTRGKLPGMLCLHDHGGLLAWGKEKLIPCAADEHPALTAHKEKYYDGLSVGHELASEGFAVLAIDQFYFGDRRLSGVPDVDSLDISNPEDHETFEAVAGEKEPVAALDVLQSGATLMGFAVWDAIRAVEFLADIDGVDSRRIGCFGSFSGGLLALYLSGLYDLVRATCAAGWVTSYANMVDAGVPGARWCQFAVPGLYNFLDLPDIGSLTVPRALCLMAMENEPFFPGRDAAEPFDKVRSVFQDVDHGDDLLCHTYPGDARFTRQMLSDAVRWFRRWL